MDFNGDLSEEELCKITMVRASHAAGLKPDSMFESTGYMVNDVRASHAAGNVRH